MKCSLAALILYILMSHRRNREMPPETNRGSVTEFYIIYKDGVYNDTKEKKPGLRASAVSPAAAEVERKGKRNVYCDRFFQRKELFRA